MVWSLMFLVGTNWFFDMKDMSEFGTQIECEAQATKWRLDGDVVKCVHESHLHTTFVH